MHAAQLTDSSSVKKLSDNRAVAVPSGSAFPQAAATLLHASFTSFRSYRTGTTNSSGRSQTAASLCCDGFDVMSFSACWAG